MSVAWMAALVLAGCTGTPEQVELELRGPTEVRVEVLGPVEGPTLMLTDDTAPQGVELAVSPPTVAQIQQGKVVAVGAGDATVTATWEEQVVTWSLKVEQPIVLDISKAPATMLVGDTAELTLSKHRGEDVIKVSEVKWTARPDTVLSVSEDGKVTAIAPGMGWVSASEMGAKAMVEITVQAP